MSVCPNVVTAGFRINGTPSSSTPILAFTYDGVFAGSMSAIQKDQVVIFSRTSNVLDGYYVARVRDVPTGTTSGTFNVSETSYPLLDNDYVFVIEDYRIMAVLAKEVAGQQYKDGTESFAQLAPMVVGLKMAYAGYVSAATGKLRVAFDLSASYAATSGKSITAWSWSVAGTTTISGSTSSAVVTLDFPASDGTWYTVTVTDSDGRTLVRHFIVFAHDNDHPPISAVDTVNLTGDVATGWNGSFISFGGELTGKLKNSLVVVWVKEWYNDIEGNIYDNILFVGRLRKPTVDASRSERAGLVSQTTYQLEGIAAQLQRLHGALIAEINADAPAAYDQIKNLTIWRGIVQMLLFHSTYLGLHDLSFDDTGDDYMAKSLRTQGGNLLAAINDLSYSINAGIEFAKDGSSRVIRDLTYRTTAQRDAMFIQGTWGVADLLKYTLNADDGVLTVGKVDASAGTYFKYGAIDEVYPYLSIAPGTAFEQADGTGQLARQILKKNLALQDAITEINERGGRHFAKLNVSETLDLVFPDGYHFLNPSLGYWQAFDLPASNNELGRAILSTERWLLTRVSLSFNNDSRTCDVSGSVVHDIDEGTVGASGDRVEYPNPEISVPTLPALPPISPYPGLPDIGLPTLPPPIVGDPINPLPSNIKKDGNTVVTWSATQIWVCLNFKSPLRKWREITPAGDMTFRQCLFDPFPDSVSLWVLANDGTDSFVYFTDNFIVPTWEQGATTAGIYTELRSTDVAGGIMVYSPASDSGAWTHTFDFTVDDGGFVQNLAVPNPSGTWVLGSGWVYTDVVYAPGPDMSRSVRIRKTFTSAHITRIVMTYDLTRGSHILDGDLSAALGAPNAGVLYPTSNGTGLTLDSGVGSATGTNIDLTVFADYHGLTMDGNCVITAVRIDGDGTSPFGDSGGTAVAYSNDNGASWSAILPVGLSPGSVGGFDTQRVGSVSLAAADAQSYSATSLGGAFSTLGTDGATSGSDPVLLLLTWGRMGVASTGNWNTSTPDYILGSAALVSGECLWYVEGAGGRHDITPAGVTGIPSNNCLTTYFGTKAALIASVSGTRHLFTTTNLGSSPTWTDRGAVGADADFCRPLRLSPTVKEFFYVDGTDTKFALDYATVQTAATPSANTLLGIEVYG